MSIHPYRITILILSLLAVILGGCSDDTPPANYDPDAEN